MHISHHCCLNRLKSSANQTDYFDLSHHRHMTPYWLNDKLGCMLCHNISSGINNYNADGILANFLLQKGSDRLAKKSIRLKRIYIYIFLNNLTKKSAKVIKIPPNQSEALIQILRLLKISIFKTALHQKVHWHLVTNTCQEILHQDLLPENTALI